MYFSWDGAFWANGSVKRQAELSLQFDCAANYQKVIKQVGCQMIKEMLFSASQNCMKWHLHQAELGNSSMLDAMYLKRHW